MYPQAKDQITQAAIRIITMQHVRSMLSYYLIRELIENSTLAEEEREPITAVATETRRSGFKLEMLATPLGIHLENYDEERLRREAARITQLSQSSPAQAYEAGERLVEDLVSDLLSHQEAEIARPLAA